MALAAFVALLHDLVVIGVLTILGYSLYDTVVVFGKVRENTLQRANGVSFADAAGRAVDQTVLRSVSTSLIALLPVTGMLIAGTVTVGAQTLQDLALALFVGIVAGTYSSIFIAVPLLVRWERRGRRNGSPAPSCENRGVCGRYVADASMDDLAAEFAAIADGSVLELMASFNVAPTDRVPVVLERTDEPLGRTRQLHAARWGLIPSWAKDQAGGAKMINARIETVADKPAYRGPVVRRRCIVPASGYYEWQRGGGSGSGTKRPFYIHPSAGLLAMAGVFDWWRDDSVPADHPDRWVLSASVLTTTPAPSLAHIHDRMPVMLTAAEIPDWLDRGNDDAAALLDLARSAAGRVGDSLVARPVGPDVGNVRNNHPGLVTEAVPAQSDLLGG